MATKDQNSRMPISLRGIDRRPQDNVEDGALLELINLRFTDNALRPVAAKTRQAQPTPQYRIIYKHILSETKYALWGINFDDPDYYLAYTLYENGSAVSAVMEYKLVGSNDVVFSALGNALMISDRLNVYTFVSLFKHNTDTYLDYDLEAPSMPPVSVWFVPSGGAKSWVQNYPTYEEAQEALSNYATVYTGEMHDEGSLNGPYVVRFCWELFDGSLVQYSCPIALPPGLTDLEGKVVDLGAEYEMTIYGFGARLGYLLSINSDDLNAFKAKYAGIIVSLNIYITEHFAPDNFPSLSIWRSLYKAYYYTPSQWSDFIKSQINFHKVCSIPLAELTNANSYPQCVANMSLLSSQVLMTPGNLSSHRLYGDTLYTYNQRVFLGNVINRLYAGMTLEYLMQEGQWNCDGPEYQIGLSFDIDTYQGTKRVFSGWTACNFYRGKVVSGKSYVDASIHGVNTIGKTGAAWTVNEWVGYMVGITSGTGNTQWRQIISNTADTLTVDTNWTTTPDGTSDFSIFEPDYFQFTLDVSIYYPDFRAKVVMVWHKGQDQVIHRLYSKNLISNITANYSFAMAINLFPLDSVVGRARICQPLSDWVVLPIDEDPSYLDNDRIQACEFNNPLYYPAENSYRVDGFVLGVASNAVPLGASQFGEFPLFVFTTKGIWAMSIGIGEVLIETVKPLSQVICTNKKSILGIDGGVVFMANEGLMIISGVNSASISDPIIGNPVSPLTGLLDFEKIINNPNTYQPKDYIDDIAFRTYADGATIAFVTVILSKGTPQKEIIVSNPDYDYSYVFNMVSKSWYRITQSWDAFLHDYPKTYGSKYVNPTFWLDDLTTEVQSSTQEILIHLETRQIKFGEELSFKKLRRSLVYGWLNMATEKPFTMFIFGSVDKEHWFTQTASQLITPGEQVAVGRTLFSCRSFIIVLGGYVHEDSYIQGLVADIEKRYNDKLR